MAAAIFFSANLPLPSLMGESTGVGQTQESRKDVQHNLRTQPVQRETMEATPVPRGASLGPLSCILCLETPWDLGPPWGHVGASPRASGLVGSSLQAPRERETRSSAQEYTGEKTGTGVAF
eukprot:jgi/Botrbrau1/4482/Bobra.0220s0016.1